MKRGRGSDQRGAAHPHLADRNRHFLRSSQNRGREPMREEPLIDDFDAVAVRSFPECAIRFAADVHEYLLRQDLAG